MARSKARRDELISDLRGAAGTAVQRVRSASTEAKRRLENIFDPELRAKRARGRAQGSESDYPILTIAGEEVIMDEDLFDLDRPQHAMSVTFSAGYESAESEGDKASQRAAFKKIFGPLQGRARGPIDAALEQGVFFGETVAERDIIEDGIERRIQTLSSEVLRIRSVKEGMMSADIVAKLRSLEVLKAIEKKIRVQKTKGIIGAPGAAEPTVQELQMRDMLVRMAALFLQGQKPADKRRPEWSGAVAKLNEAIRDAAVKSANAHSNVDDWLKSDGPKDQTVFNVFRVINEAPEGVLEKLYNDYVAAVKELEGDGFGPIKDEFNSIIAGVAPIRDVKERLVRITGSLFGLISQKVSDRDRCLKTVEELTAASAAAAEEATAAEAAKDAADEQVEEAKKGGAASSVAMLKASTSAEEANRQLAASTTRNEELQSALTAAQERLRFLEEQVGGVEALRLQLSTAQSAAAEATGLLQGKDGQIAEIKEQLSYLERERDTARKEYAEIQQRQNQLTLELTNRLRGDPSAAGGKAAIDALNAQIAAANERIETKDTRIGELNTEIGRIRDQLGQVQAAAGAAEGSRAAAEVRASTAEAARVAAAAEVEAARASAASAQARITDIERQLADARGQITDVEATRGARATAEGRLGGLQEQLEAARNAASEANRRQRELEASAARAAATAAAEKAELERGLLAARGQVAAASAAAAAATTSAARERGRLEATLNELRGQIATLQAQLTDAQRQTAATGQERTSQQDRISSLQAQIASLEEQQSRVVGFIDELRRSPANPPSPPSGIPTNASQALTELLRLTSRLQTDQGAASSGQDICFLSYFITYYVRLFLLKNDDRDAGLAEQRTRIRNSLLRIINSEAFTTQTLRGQGLSLETIVKSLHTVIQTIEEIPRGVNTIQFASLPDDTTKSIKYIIEQITRVFNPTDQIHGQMRRVVQSTLSGISQATLTAYIQTYDPDETASSVPFAVYHKDVLNFPTTKNMVLAQPGGQTINEVNVDKVKDTMRPAVTPLFLTYESTILLFILFSRKYLMEQGGSGSSTQCPLPRDVVDLQPRSAAAPPLQGPGGTQGVGAAVAVAAAAAAAERSRQQSLREAEKRAAADAAAAAESERGRLAAVADAGTKRRDELLAQLQEVERGAEERQQQAEENLRATEQRLADAIAEQNRLRAAEAAATAAAQKAEKESAAATSSTAAQGSGRTTSSFTAVTRLVQMANRSRSELQRVKKEREAAELAAAAARVAKREAEDTARRAEEEAERVRREREAAEKAKAAAAAQMKLDFEKSMREIREKRAAAGTGGPQGTQGAPVTPTSGRGTTPAPRIVPPAPPRASPPPRTAAPAPTLVPSLETHQKTFFGILRQIKQGYGAKIKDVIAKDFQGYTELGADLTEEEIKSRQTEFPISRFINKWGLARNYFNFPEQYTSSENATKSTSIDISSLERFSSEENLQKTKLKRMIDFVYKSYKDKNTGNETEKVRAAKDKVYKFLLDFCRAYYEQYIIKNSAGVEIIDPQKKFDVIYSLFDTYLFSNTLLSNKTLTIGQSLGITKDIMRDYIFNKKEGVYPIQKAMSADTSSSRKTQRGGGRRRNTSSKRSSRRHNRIATTE